jgi:hypothetical protein
MVVQTTQKANLEALEEGLEAAWEWCWRGEFASEASRGEDIASLLKP